MESKKTSALKKLVIGILVAIALAAGGYFGLNISEKQVIDAVSPVVDSVLGSGNDTPEAPEATPVK